MKIEEIARVCHEANKAYCKSIGDFSQKSWSEAEEWQRESAIQGVRFILDNLNAPACATHDSWLKEKLESGWKYGPIKDPDKKEHPCCVDYEDLPDKEKKKDYLFMAIVKALQ